MIFYTSTSFRSAISMLTRKPKDGYGSVVKDICDALSSMDDSFLRETRDMIRQEQNFRIVKLRVKNSHQKLPKNDAFRLIYWVSIKSDNLVLLTVYPKRGPYATKNLTNAEFKRLLEEMLHEKEDQKLQKVDVTNNLEVIENNCAW